MTVTREPQQTRPPVQTHGRHARRRDSQAVLEVCPFLAAEDGSWRSAYAAREHRCHAVHPAALLAVAKQRQLCLLADHASCATFVAAQDVAMVGGTGIPDHDGALLWPSGVAAPVVLEPARRMGALPSASARGGGQAILIGLMVLAFLVLVIARTQSPAGVAGGTPPVADVAGSAASPVPGGVVAASDPASPGSTAPLSSPDATPSEVANSPMESTPGPTMRPTAGPTPAPTATAAAMRTYKVKSGDTLSAIAARFDTTVKKLAALNDIADPRSLRIGQVLQIP